MKVVLGKRFSKGIQRIQNFVKEVKSESRRNPKLKVLIIIDVILLILLAYCVYSCVYSLYYITQHSVTVKHIPLFI